MLPEPPRTSPPRDGPRCVTRRPIDEAVAASPLGQARRRRARALRTFARVIAAIAFLVATVGPALAFDLETRPPHEERGLLRVRARVVDLLPDRVEASLARGMPATLQYRTELWRRRSGWFHKLENSLEFSLKIRYDVWSKTYLIERNNLEPMVLPSLDSLRVALSQPVVLPVAPMTKLEGGAEYYVVTTATLKPLTVEDVAEGEGWLSGEVENKRQAGLGIITALPQSLFDAMRNFAGLGDLRARRISVDFTLADLSDRP